MLYLIAYDLCADGQDYRAISQAIASLAESEDDCCHIQKSVWVIRSAVLTAKTLLEKLDYAMDENDQCFVTRLGYYPAWTLLPENEAQLHRMMKRDKEDESKPIIL